MAKKLEGKAAVITGGSGRSSVTATPPDGEGMVPGRPSPGRPDRAPSSAFVDLSRASSVRPGGPIFADAIFRPYPVDLVLFFVVVVVVPVAAGVVASRQKTRVRAC